MSKRSLAGGFNAQGQAERLAGAYQVSGKSAFATGCGHADWLFGNCVVMQDGKPRPGPAEGIPETRGMLSGPPTPASSTRGACSVSVGRAAMTSPWKV